MFRGASLNVDMLRGRLKAERQTFSFRGREECPRNWAAAVDNTATNNPVSFSWDDETLFGMLISRDT